MEDEQLIIIRTLEELALLKQYLEDKQYVAIDTETDGVDKDSRIIGFSICAEQHIGFYVIVSYWDFEKQELIDLETKAGTKEFLEYLKQKDLIAHNAIFDCYMIENNYGVSLMPHIFADTMIMGHLLNENRSNGLKELGVSIFGEDAKKEQLEMKESVTRNGGKLTKDQYELYKGDADLIARYGAKDTILTLKLFNLFIPELYAQGLDKFYFEDESMPLLRSATYELNTVGLRVDYQYLMKLRGELEASCLQDMAYVTKEIEQIVKKEYPGTNKKNTFNVVSNNQLSWLLYIKLDNDFHTLTKEGKEVCKFLGLKLPYSPAVRRDFIQSCRESKGRIYVQPGFDTRKKKKTNAKKIRDPWVYLAATKESLTKLAKKYKWLEVYLRFKKEAKLRDTYVIGIQERMKYNIIRPSFLQHGTTSGRYSSKNPNFQNLPRDDKRVKKAIVSRPNKVFVGADYSQLEPRVFASFSGDERLIDCFKNGEDFYSVIGMEVFEKYDCTAFKDDKNSFAKKYPELRQISKAIALAATYGTTPSRMASIINKSVEEARDVINSYFEKFPSVLKLMLESHEIAKDQGRVVNLFGRPRRMPMALEIRKTYGPVDHAELPYEARNTLNLAVNHRIQSTGASIMNRAAIAFLEACRANNISANLVLQVHDELVAECSEQDADKVVQLLKHAMETTTILPNVALIAEPKIANNLADLK